MSAEDYRDDVWPDPDTGAAHDDPLLAGLRNGAWLDRQYFPPLRYAVPGIIPEGSTLLVGAPKIGKSWLVLSWALARAAGGVALSALKIDAGPVLYLALEDGDRRMQDRCRTLLCGDRIPPAFDYLTRVEPGRVIDTIAAWLKRHPGAAPLVILDTLGKVMPPAVNGESAYQRDYRIGSALKVIAESEPGAAVLVNHHDRKAASEDFVDAVSGTHGLAGAADTTVQLVRGRNDTAGLIKVTGRDVVEGEYAVMFTGSLWKLDGHDLEEASAAARTRAATAGLGDRSVEILAFVAEHPEGVGPTTVGHAFGMEPKHAGTYLTRLADAGRIVKAGRGDYRPRPPVETVESVDSAFHTPTLTTPPHEYPGEMA
jgi:AAA domain